MIVNAKDARGLSASYNSPVLQNTLDKIKYRAEKGYMFLNMPVKDLNRDVQDQIQGALIARGFQVSYHTASDEGSEASVVSLMISWYKHPNRNR